MPIPNIIQKTDLEIVIIRHQLSNPSFLFLYSSILMRQIGLATNPGQTISAAMNQIGQATIKLAQDYAYPTSQLDAGSAKEAFNLFKGVHGDLQEIFNNVFLQARNNRAHDFVSSETPVCWAFTLDFGKNYFYPKISNDAQITSGIFGFFTPGKSVLINALPNKWLPDVKDPCQFNVIGF
jgi:hypothetical protein